MNTETEKFSKLIKDVHAQIGLSQEELVSEPGVSFATNNKPTMFGSKFKVSDLIVPKRIVGQVRFIQNKLEQISKLQYEVDSELAKFQSALLVKAFRGDLSS